MKCSQQHCNTQVSQTNPPITIMFGHRTTGNIWGNYCSYDCLLQEVGSVLVHLKTGKPLANYKTPETIQGFVNLVNEAWPNGQIAQPQMPQGNIPINITVQAPPVFNVNDTDDDEDDDDEIFDTPPTQQPQVTAPTPGQADHLAWGGGAPMGQQQPNAVVANDDLQKIHAISAYASTLTSHISTIMPNDVGFAHTSQTSNDAFDNVGTVQTTHYIWQMTIDGYSLAVRLLPTFKDNKYQLRVLFNGGENKYALTIDHTLVAYTDTANALIKHCKAITVPLKEAQQNAAVAGNDAF